MKTSNEIRQAARQAFGAGKISYSIGLYKELFDKAENTLLAEDIINYGALLRSTKQLQKASTHYNRYLPQFSDNIHLIQNACNCWIDLKDFKRSRSALQLALSKNKNNTALLISLGFTELSANKIERAREIFEEILRIDSEHFDAWFNLAVAQAKAGSLEEALTSFREADKRQADNQLLKANIISILQDLGRIEQAWKELTELGPVMRSTQQIKTVESSLMMARENYEEASHLLLELTQEDPNNAKHWIKWTTCLKAMKYTVAPHKILQTALLWHPEDIDLQHSFAQSMAEMGKLECYKRTHHCWKRRINELSSEHIYSRQFLELSSERVDSKARRELARYWEEKQLNPESRNLWADRISINRKDRRIKIGYLSADWRNHPVGRFMLPILKNHNKNKFETWCIDSTTKHDWISDQLKQNSEHWVNIKNLNGLQAARRISDEQLDVLVELGGFTGQSRLDCLVHRPCAIQLSYLGYPAPTHLKCIDGWIGDEELFSTLSTDESSAHQLLLINGGYMAFEPGDGIPEPKREDSDTFRFGCFNHARKLSKPTLALFCKVLKECAGSILYLKSISFHEQSERLRIRKKFEQHGIEPERLIILDWVKGGLNHLACYNLIDAALDPFPYGGATTTAEALWMGVPVVSRRHSGMAGCLSSSLLSYGNQKHWITNSEAEYVDVAKQLFTQGNRDKKERIKLRREMENSPVGDAQRLSQELESIYYNLISNGAAPSS